MARITVDTFLEYLQRSRILSPNELEGVRDLALGFDDATEFARLLSKREILTRWQAAQLLAGRTQVFLGKYKLIERLGRGGMGNVYLAEHTAMDRRVALKVVSHKGEDSTAVDLLRSEARAIGLLDHPNIIQAYDVDSEGDRFFIVMEYVPGRDLNAMVMDEGPLPLEQAVDYIRQAAEGLAHAHDRGMIHCDIKPSNLLVDSEGVVKILDLGVARLSDEENVDEDSDSKRPLGGTIDYQAPEHARGSNDFDSRADIYSLGCTLYCLLAGHPPFPSGSQTKRILQHQTEPAPDLRSIRPEIPADLNAICLRMLEKDPQKRYQTAHEVAEILAEWTPPEAPAPSFGDSDGTDDVLDDPLGLNPLELNTLQESLESSAIRRHRRTNTLAHLWIAASFVLAVVMFLIILIVSQAEWERNTEGLEGPIVIQPKEVVEADPNTQNPPKPEPGREGSNSKKPKDTGDSPDTPPDHPPKPPGPAENPPIKPPGGTPGEGGPTGKPDKEKPKVTPTEKQPKPPEPKPPKPKPKPKPVPVFNTFPKMVSLPEVSERAPKPLGALEGPAKADLALELLGGSFRIASESLEFKLVESEPGKIWNIELDSIPVARIERDENRVVFEWDSAIPDAKAAHAALLQYTILRLKSGDKTHELVFTRPKEVPPISGDFQKETLLKRSLPEIPIRGDASFRVEMVKIVGPQGAVPLKNVGLLSAERTQQTLDVPQLQFAKIELTFILSSSHDSVNMGVKYSLPGGTRMASLSRSQVPKLRAASANSRAPRTANAAAEVLTLADEFAKSGKVYFRAYREIGDKQLDVVITKDPPPPEKTE